MAEGVHVVEVPTSEYLALLGHLEALQAELAGTDVREDLSADLLGLVDEMIAGAYRHRDVNRMAALEAHEAGRPTFEIVFSRGRESFPRTLLDVLGRLDWLARHGELRTPPAPPEALQVLRHVMVTLAERTE